MKSLNVQPILSTLLNNIANANKFYKKDIESFERSCKTIISNNLMNETFNLLLENMTLWKEHCPKDDPLKNYWQYLDFNYFWDQIKDLSKLVDLSTMRGPVDLLKRQEKQIALTAITRKFITSCLLEEAQDHVITLNEATFDTRKTAVTPKPLWTISKEKLGKIFLTRLANEIRNEIFSDLVTEAIPIESNNLKIRVAVGNELAKAYCEDKYDFVQIDSKEDKVIFLCDDEDDKDYIYSFYILFTFSPWVLRKDKIYRSTLTRYCKKISKGRIFSLDIN